jgi:hypothetical protein
MRGRIHTLQNEIKALEDMLDNLSGPMLELALEELRNMQFERDMLFRSAEKNEIAQLTDVQQVHEAAHQAW